MQFLKFRKYNTKKRSVLLLFLFSFLLTFPLSLMSQKQYIVVLDAGHGGHDFGKYVKRFGYKEKNIALKITKLVGNKLGKVADIKIVYTRTTDVFINLWKRGDIANKAGADLFVSIHCNAHHTKAFGSETWVLGLHANRKNFEVAKRENSVILLEDNYEEKYEGFDPKSPESVIGLTLMQEENLDKSLLLASTIQEHFRSKLNRVDRGVKQAGFVVLHQTTMPSVLIEAGFITNRREGMYLNSKKGQEEVASSIAEAIKKYINQLKLNTVDVLIDENSIKEGKEEAVANVPAKPIAEEEKTISEETTVKKDTVTKKNHSANKEKEKHPKEVEPTVLFRVQLASGSQKLDTESRNFKGLENVERIKLNKVYKYYYGGTPNYKQAQSALKTARKRGYASAFIVAFKNKERISVREALKNL